MADRAAKAAQRGKKPGGRVPQAPVEGRLPTDQVNLTDENSRIMPVAGGGFEQCYNAQAAVAADSLLNTGLHRRAGRNRTRHCFGVFARGKPCVGIARAKSSEKSKSLLRVRRPGARKCNTPTIITGKSTPTGC